MKSINLLFMALVILITMGAQAQEIDEALDGSSKFAKQDESLDFRRVNQFNTNINLEEQQQGVQSGYNPYFGGMFTNPNQKADEDLAEVVIKVNRSTNYNNRDAQTMKVYHRGVLVRTFKISTGKSGHSTPLGYYRPIYSNHMRIYQNYFSGTYSGAAMKWAVFFNGGIAIHSTPESNYKRLGKAASHGCVRMRMEDAKWVNELIRSTGSQNTQMRKWRHAKHSKTNLWNEYYKGAEIQVPAIDKRSGKETGKYIKSVDTVIIVTQ